MDRKSFIKTSALAAAAFAMPRHSFGAVGGSDKIKVALVGCGSRGTGAISNMFDADNNIHIVALGDLFPDAVAKCEKVFKAHVDKRNAVKSSEVWKVKPETTFFGLDAIDKVLNTDADVVALATTPVFRTSQIEKCLKAGKHVFAEKPICIDATQYRKVVRELIPLADSKGLNVLCGTQMRYQSAIREAVDRVRDGQIGDIISGVFLRYEGTYLTKSGWIELPQNLRPETVEYQLRNWLAFRWTSGDQMVEQYVHNLDMALWAFGELPSEAVGSGGRQSDIPHPQMGDRYSNCHVQFDFPSGKTLTAACRQEFSTTPYAPFRVYGTKGVLEMSFGKQRISGEKPWESEYQKKPELVCEHEALFGAIRKGEHLNTMKACADSCFAGILGRESCYSSKRLKWDWILAKSMQNYLPQALSLGGGKPIEPVPFPAKYNLEKGAMES